MMAPTRAAKGFVLIGGPLISDILHSMQGEMQETYDIRLRDTCHGYVRILPNHSCYRWVHRKREILGTFGP